MVDLLIDTLNNNSDIVYRKCGEVIVAPKRNVFALYCIFCQDIFVHVQEFMRHARRLHDDEFEFERHEDQDTDVYSVEELMDGMSYKEIIAQEQLEWTRRNRLQYMSENKVLEIIGGNESAKEWTDMEYLEDKRDSVEIGKVTEGNSQKMVPSGEEEYGTCKERQCDIYTQGKNNSPGDDENPDLDDLLKELDDDLDNVDISIIKKLTSQTQSLPQIETNKNKICYKNKIDPFFQLEKFAENVVDNNLKSNFKNLKLITEFGNTSLGQSKVYADKRGLCSNSSKTMTILEPQFDVLKKNAKENNLPNSSNQHIVVENSPKISNDIKLEGCTNYSISKEQHLTLVGSSNNEFRKNKNTKFPLMKEITISKSEKARIDGNKGVASTRSPVQQKDIMLNKAYLTVEKPFNKMLQVRVKNISPPHKAKEGSEMNLNKTSDKISNTEIKTNTKSNLRRSLRIKSVPLEEQKILKKRSLVAENKSTPKKKDVPMEAASPIKNIFSKQNFTEDSIKEIVLSRENNSIETHTQTKQMIRKPFAIARQRKASIDVLQKTSLNNNNPEVDRTTRKKQVLDRMSQIRKRITKIIDKENLVGLQPKKNANNIEITNVTILPTIEYLKTKYHSTHSTPFDAFIETKAKATERSTKTPTLVSNSEQISLKIDISSLKKKQICKNEDVTELTKIDLSESVLDFLQDDLYQTKLDINQPDNILEAAPIETECKGDTNFSTKNDDSSSTTLISEKILDQVGKETQAKKLSTLSKRTKNEEPSHKINSENPNVKKIAQLKAESVSLDGYKTTHEEIKLLSKVGLTILKSPNEILPVQEEELLRFKAKKFANILRNMENIWQPRRLKDIHTNQLNSTFLEMTSNINSAFKINVNSIEVKRICNVVMSWYTRQLHGKLPNEIPESVNFQYYIQLFSFLPKTGRPIYNCEFCDQQYRSEGAYSIHRCNHTGGVAFSCFHCGKGYMKSSSHKTHERSHLIKKNENKNWKAIKTENNSNLKASTKNSFLNSKSYLKRFRSPDNKTENVNSKRFQTDATHSDLSHIKFQNASE